MSTAKRTTNAILDVHEASDRFQLSKKHFPLRFEKAFSENILIRPDYSGRHFGRVVWPTGLIY